VRVSATLAVDELVRRRQAEGRPVLPLAFGQAGVPVHASLRRALAEAAGRGEYGSVAGTAELREAAAGYWHRRGLPTDPGRVVAGPGSKALLYAVLRAAGGDVVLPRPSWVSYAAQAALLGVRHHPVPTPPGEGGVPDPERLADTVRRARAEGRDVRAVVLTVPDNPTGTLATAGTVRTVCEVARRLDLMIISDEIYRDLVYHGGFASPAEFAPERVVVTSGLSKSLALGGWRIGVARFPEGATGDRLRERVLSAASEIWSSPAQPVQFAAALALAEPADLAEHIARGRALYRRITTAVAEGFIDAGATVAAPRAAFYLYPDFGAHRERLAAVHSVHTGAELAELLLERCGVAVLPGSAFGEPAHALTLRVCTGLLTGADDEQRQRALDATDALELPWIAGALDQLGAALSTVVG